MNRLLESLPSKEAKDLKAVVGLFDNSRYKAALKNLRKVENKHSKREEYKMFRNLLRICDNQKMEKADYTTMLAESKQLLRKNLKKGFFWQMLGMIQKRHGDYEEASKTLTQALRFEKDNMVLYRDACNLLFHSRDLEAHLVKRKEMLMAKSSVYGYWGAYAVALEMVGDYNGAEDIIKSLREMMMTERKAKAKASKNKKKQTQSKKQTGKKEESEKSKNKKSDKPLYYMEYSEVTIFQAQMLIKSGRHTEAVQILKQEMNCNITDKSRANELIIEACLKARNLKGLKKVLKKEGKKNPFRLDILFLNTFIWINSSAYSPKLTCKIFGLLEQKKYFRALQALCADHSSDKKFLTALREYLILATKNGRMESIEYLIIWVNSLLGEQQREQTEMRLLIRRNCMSTNPAFFRKMRILCPKEQLIDCAINRNTEKPSKETGSIGNIETTNPFYDADIDTIISVSREKLEQVESPNQTIQILHILLNDLQSFNNTGAFGSISETLSNPTTFQTQLLEKYKPYFQRKADFTSACFLLYNAAVLFAKISETGTAIYILNYLIASSPGMDEAYLLRAKLLFKMGFWPDALQDFEIFRRMNHQDRCEMSMALSRLFKTGAFKKAERLFNYFMIIGAEVPYMDRVRDLQKFEQILRAARGYQANGQLIRALRYAKIALDTFKDMKSDQFDFISFGFRTHSLKAVSEMRDLVDGIQEIGQYGRAVGKYLGLLMRLKNMKNGCQYLEEKTEEDWMAMASGEGNEYRYLEELGYQSGTVEWKYEHQLNKDNWDEDVPEDKTKQNDKASKEEQTKENNEAKHTKPNQETEEETKSEEPKETQEEKIARRKKDYPCLTLEKHRTREGDKAQTFQKTLKKLDMSGEKMIANIDFDKECESFALKALDGTNQNNNVLEMANKSFYHRYVGQTGAHKLNVKVLSKCFKALLTSSKVLGVIRSYHQLLKTDPSQMNLLRRVQFYDFISKHLNREDGVPKDQTIYSSEWEPVFNPETLDLNTTLTALPKSPINTIISEFLALEPALFQSYSNTQTDNPVLQDIQFSNLFREYLNKRNWPNFVKQNLTKLKSLVLERRKQAWGKNEVGPEEAQKVCEVGQEWLVGLKSGRQKMKVNAVAKQISSFVKIEFF